MLFDGDVLEGEIIEGGGPCVNAVILYDVMRPDERDLVELDWWKDKTIADYMVGLPSENQWSIYTSKGVVHPDEWAVTTLLSDERIVVTLLPEGAMFKILAMVALVIVASLIAGPAGTFLAASIGGLSAGVWGSVVAGLVMALGGILISALMPAPAKPKGASDSPSYSLQGAKNTAAQGVPVPYGYGEFRVAGNRINIYVENDTSATTQIVYTQYVISDGEIDSISDIEVNERPLAEFNSVQFESRLGLIDQEPISWFAQSVVPMHVGTAISNDNDINYTTSQEVDRFRLDISFPQGLYRTDSETGELIDWNGVPITGKYRLRGTTTWKSLNNEGWVSIEPTSLINKSTNLRVTVQYAGDADGPISAFNGTVKAVHVLDQDPPNGVDLSTWLMQSMGGGGVFETEDGTEYTVPASTSSVVATDSGTIVNTVLFDNATGESFIPGVLTRTYEIGGIDTDESGGGGGIFNWTGQSSTNKFGIVMVGDGTVVGIEVVLKNQLHFKTDKKLHPRNFSVWSPALPRGVYEINLKRDTKESTKATTMDKAVLDDVNEVQTDPVAYNGTAYYAVAIGLTDQLSGEPNITVKAKMRKVNIYDKNGVINEFRWSDNPANIALDVLLAWRSRYNIPTSRIDFFAFDRWRTFCTTNNLTFNGVFDTETNLWDALQDVMMAGRANIVMSGVRWSVIIDQPREAVMMFTSDNMVKGTFQSHWSGLDQRANHIEWKYFDKTDRNKMKSVFAINNDALDRGEAVRKASIVGMGFDNPEQATTAAQLQLNRNRYILQGVAFEVPVEALGCMLGDVVYVQNDMPQWGYSAMVTGVIDPTNIQIDTQIPFDGSLDWRIMFVQGAVLIDTQPIDYISNREVRFAGFSVLPKVHRLLVQSDDYEVMDEVIVGNDLVLTLDRAFDVTTGLGVGDDAKFYRTDVMCEGTLAAAPAIQLEGQPLLGAGNISVTYGVIEFPLTTEEIETLTTESGSAFILEQHPVFAYGHVEFEIWGEDDTRILAEEAAASDHVDLHITSWVNAVHIPQPGDRVMIGKMGRFKKPFQINKINFKDDHTRALDMLEYSDSLYDAAPEPPPPSIFEYPLLPQQVSNLRVSQLFEQLLGGAMSYVATASWDRPLNDVRGYAGVKIYISVNFTPFILSQTLTDATSYQISAKLGDVVRFRVVAFDRIGASASYPDAPTFGVTIVANDAIPAAPFGVTLTPGVQQIALNWRLTTSDYIASTEVWQGISADRSDATRVWVGRGTHWLGTGIAVDKSEFFWLRTISITGVPSAWVGPYEDAATTVQAMDIQLGAVSALHMDENLTGLEFVDVLPTENNYSGRLVFVDPEDSVFIFRAGAWEPFVHNIDATDITGEIISDQIQGLAAAKLQGQIQTAQIAPGAVTQTKIGERAVSSINMAHGAVGRNNMGIGVGTNECWNSCLEITSAGWVFEATADMALTGMTQNTGFDPTWRLAGYGSGVMAAAAPLTTAGVMNANWDPNATDGMVGIPWRPDRVIEVQAALLPMACAGMVGVQFLNSTGNIISTWIGRRITYPGLPTDGKAINSYERSFVSVVAPTGTVRARPFVRGVNDGGADIYATGGAATLFFTQFSVGQGMPYAAEPQPWQPGGGPSLSGQVIKPATISATQIAVGALSNLQSATAASQAVAGSISQDVLSFTLDVPAGAAVLIIWSGTTNHAELTLTPQCDGVALTGSPAIHTPAAGARIYTLTATNAGGSSHTVTTCQMTVLALNR